jgi:hypothetical protein
VSATLFAATFCPGRSRDFIDVRTGRVAVSGSRTATMATPVTGYIAADEEPAAWFAFSGAAPSRLALAEVAQIEVALRLG